MTLSWTEGWASIVLICFVGLVYFGGETLRDDLKISTQKPWRWGDEQRRGGEEATWGTHLVIAPVCMFITVLTIRLMLWR